MIICPATPLILMLGYKSLAGKDTFFSFAEELGFKRLAFADKLKETVSDLYNLSYEQVHGNLKDVEDTRYANTIDSEWIVDESVWGDSVDIQLALDNGVEYEEMLIKNPEYKKFFTPRRLLQIVGQQQRTLFPDIWASYVFSTSMLKLRQQGFDKFIITDFRFRNEAKVAKEFNRDNCSNLHFIKINRPNVLSKSSPSDISENDLNDFAEWSYVLNNEGTLEEYKDKVINLLEILI